MKISILTATYNRGELLNNLYNSLIQNIVNGLEIEWLIMDDGSTDNTQNIVEEFIKENKIKIIYKYQGNQGKMIALNNILQYSTGDLIIDCDSDDYFTQDAFKIIKEQFESTNPEGLYAICFLKQNKQGKIDGNTFAKEKSTMFDIYFKEGITGEKILVYYSGIRKKYKHEIENNEKFVTEARMYNKMDEKYKIKCVNKPILIGEYLKDGYTNNILKTFAKNPYGYFKYFEEMLSRNMSGVIISKKIYAIKHYILFSTLTKKKIDLKKIKNISNKILVIILYIPGKVMTKIRLRKGFN